MNNKYVDLDVNMAKANVEKEGLKARVIDMDSPNMVTTADIRDDRVNLIVKDGKVVGTSRG